MILSAGQVPVMVKDGTFSALHKTAFTGSRYFTDTDILIWNKAREPQTKPNLQYTLNLLSQKLKRLYPSPQPSVLSTQEGEMGILQRDDHSDCHCSSSYQSQTSPLGESLRSEDITHSGH